MSRRLKVKCLREFRDKDYVIDFRGNIYSVLGYLHYEGKVTVLPKYVPTSKKTAWRSKESYYERVIGDYGVKGLKNALKTLEENNVKLLHYHLGYGGLVPQLKISEIAKLYKPVERLRELYDLGPRDVLEEELLELASHIKSSIRNVELGVTGSVLVKIHNPKISDIDLVVYGVKSFEKLRETIQSIPRVEKLSSGEIEYLAFKRSREGRLPYRVALKSLVNRWNRFKYRGRLVTLSTVLNWEEVKSQTETVVSRVLGVTSITGEIEVTEKSLVYPPTWRLKVESVERGFKSLSGEVEVLSFENLYAYAFKTGDRVRVKGILQEVESPKNSWTRIVVGCREYVGEIDFLE